MKLALNGAITIGSLDGATVEIRDHVGADNIVLFGLTEAEVAVRKRDGFAGRNAVGPELAGVIDILASGELSPDDPGCYASIIDSLLDYDPFMVAADFSTYWAAQRQIDARWRDSSRWWHSSILNTARMGWFSSDRATREYADDIWRVPVTA
jgi:starch phosphorylase